MPGKLLGAGKSVGRFGFFSIASLFRFAIKHYVLFIFLIVVLPSVFSSVHTAIETKNPLHPFLELGKKIFASDNQIREDVIQIQEQGIDSLVGMEKPTQGIWNGIKYKWFFFWRVIFRIFGSVYLIFIPLIVIFRVLKYRNVSEVNKNFFLSGLIFFFYLFIVNVLFVMYKLITGQIQIVLQEGLTEFQQILAISLNLIPFGGLITLFQYLISLV